MTTSEGVTRREFVSTVGGAAVGAAVAGTASARPPRRSGATPSSAPACAASACGAARSRSSTATSSSSSGCATSTRCASRSRRSRWASRARPSPNFDEMLDKAKPDLLMVTTVDGYHSEYIVRGARARHRRHDREADGHRREAVPGRARRRDGRAAATSSSPSTTATRPKHQTIKELLMSGAIGKVTSVDFSWYLDTRHGADYFRRWHRLRSKSGSLWVHKATHHFDLDQLVARRRSGRRSRRSAACRTTARAARSATRRAAAARTRPSARTTGTSPRTRT